MEVSVAILVAGRCTEEIFLDHFPTGAGSDLGSVTELARKMVCEWGMSEEMVPLNFGKNREHIFLVREIARHEHYGKETAVKIDHAVKGIVLEGYARARKILQANREPLVRLAEALFEYETLYYQEFDAVLKGETIRSHAAKVAGSDESKNGAIGVLAGRQ